MTEQRRQADVQVSVLQANFDRFLERYERDQERAEGWRKEYMERIELIAKTVDEMSLAYKGVKWGSAVVFVAAVGYGIKTVFTLLGKFLFFMGFRP